MDYPYSYFLYFETGFFIRLHHQEMVHRSHADIWFEYLVKRIPVGHEIEMSRAGTVLRRESCKGK